MTEYSSTMANAFGPTQWLVILAIVVILFGGSRIPEIMRGLGTGMREFKQGMQEDDHPTSMQEDSSSRNSDSANKS